MVTRHLIIGLTVISLGFSCILNGHFLTRLTNNDPSPIFSSTDPYDFLTTCRRQQLKDTNDDCCRPHFRIAFSPVYQYACNGGDLFGNTTPCQANCGQSEGAPVTCTCATTDFPNELAQLGDLAGQWNIIGLFYNQSAQAALLKALNIKPNNCKFTVGNNNNSDNITADYLTDPTYSDTKKLLGFFSVPIDYKKYGVRFETEFSIHNDLSLSLHSGVVQISQNPEFIDLTCEATGLSCITHDCTGGTTEDGCKYSCCPPINPREDVTTDAQGVTNPANPCPNSTCCIDWANCPCKTMLIDKIMKKPDLIAEALGMNIKSFKKIDIEDIEVNLNWSHLCAINTDLADWHSFVFMPFASIGCTIPTAAEKKWNYLFSVPAGNDGHWSYGGRAGCIFDFFNAMTIGGEVGITGFSDHKHAKVPMPTSEYQSGIFPTLMSVEIRPGLNTHFTAYIGTYHFLERFSTYVQYVGIIHQKDRFSPTTCSLKTLSNATAQQSANPEQILWKKRSDESEWNVHVLNAALNYELAHCLQIGFVWQIPLSQRNAYSTSTIMGTVQATF